MIKSSKAKARLLRRQRRVFNTTRRAEFYQDMAKFSAADIPSFQGIEKMIAIVQRRRHKHLEAIYKRIADGLSGEGGSLTKGLAPEVPGGEAAMLTAAAEAGPGVLQAVLSQLASLLDRQVKINRALRKVLLSNGLVLLAITVVIAVMMVLVVPELEAGTTPQMQSLMHFAPLYFAFGAGFIEYGPWILGAVIALGVWIKWALPRWHKPRTYWKRPWFDRHFLPFKLYARTQATYFLSTIAPMMEAGMPVNNVLTGMQAFATPWFRSHLRRMLKLLEAGNSPVDALNTGFLPTDTADRLSIYELIPDVTKLMRSLADDNFEIYERRVALVGATLKAASLILLFVFAASTMYAIFDFARALTQASKMVN